MAVIITAVLGTMGGYIFAQDENIGPENSEIKEKETAKENAGKAEDSGAREARELKKIVVTPYRYEEELTRAASSFSIISEKEIEESNATSVLDLLRDVPGLVVRDWFGNTTKASIDMRGFGEQGGLNVAVLVDGRRINEVDISGVDWSQIPIGQIERIEIIRGGNSVLYGDNASAGVINIITKKGRGKLSIDANAQFGSYSMNSESLSLGGSKNSLSYFASGSWYDTEGYRNNSYLKAQDFNTKFEYEITRDSSLRFNWNYHYATYGLPGALLGTDIENFSRRYSKYGEDHASDEDYSFVLGGQYSFGSLGKIDADISYRKRNVFTNFVGANAGWNPVSKNRIETYGITPKYHLNHAVLEKENKIILGMDFYRYEYSSDTYNTADALQDFSDINKVTTAGYFQDELVLLKNLILVGGFRYEQAKYDFDYHDNAGWYPDVDTKIRPNQKAYNGGLVFNYAESSSIFFNTNQSFRFPATDEYFTWGSLNTTLKPQTSKNYELGARHRFDDRFKLDLTVFYMKIKNELYYNPVGGPFALGANENYDKTKHKGVEAGFELKLFKNIEFFTNYSYTDSRFISGDYDDKRVPMVPYNKGTIGLKIALPKQISLTMLGNYIGSRYFINDQANSFSKLNGYMTADLRAAYSFKDFNLIAGINNIFDKKYSQYGVCNNNTGAKNYYPSPERNFSLELDYKF